MEDRKLVHTNFLLGSLQLTAQARMVLKRLPYDLICRHAINEHGLITEDERRRNAHAMRVLGPIISRYKADPTDPDSRHVVITTEACWGETLIDIE